MLLGASILIPMDATQTNHLKAYGLAYFALKKDISVDWLLNYRGGSFMIEWTSAMELECKVRGLYIEKITDQQANTILKQVASPAVNMNVVRMDKAPRIAVYSPKNEFVEDDSDAVINVLDYAEIPYTIIYDDEILKDALLQYDWLHLHHEDFTGQIEKAMFRPRNRIELKMQEMTAARLGYAKVSAMKYDVVKKIMGFCGSGGYLFAMCSGAETFDIALAAQGQDIESELNGEGVELDYSKSLAFENFELKGNSDRSFSDINVGGWGWGNISDNDFFRLFDFSAKWDIVPSLLTQNHEHVIHDFNGLTTSFNTTLVKPNVLVMAENRQKPNVRYIYGEAGGGHFTYYSGHDPEGMNGGGRGLPKKTNLALYPHSPGYRLILNNVLFPSANKKKRKT
ncbi:hypothetical protein WSM22_06270 [Cytophagales bacterium WSM2-2]|nr:hypothetical protein WSM22_06270 [Cytophagales bacterium WSM2-2]